MLRDLLTALCDSPSASGLEIRSRMRLARETYEQVLGHLIRLGYVSALDLDAEVSCASGGCKGCPVSCQSSPTLGPQTLVVTERGRRFLTKGSGSSTMSAL